MNGTKVTIKMLVTFVLIVAAGCDIRPAPPRNEAGEVIRTIQVATPGEQEAAQRLIDAQAEYRQRLAVLSAYYRSAGALAKGKWAGKEINNLEKAQVFTFVDMKPAEVQRGPSIREADEATLVEMVVEARKAYCLAVDELILYYDSSAQPLKLEMADNIRRRFDPVRTYMYFLDAEVPPADLRPAEVIPAAEQLFEQALALHRRGMALGVIIDYQKQRQSLMTFLQLVRSYPTSTKIAYTGYYIAEIYRRGFDEDYRALLWYQRSVQWDPRLDKPSRFEAAKIAEFELHEHRLALQLYRDAVKYESFDAANVRYATRRIEVLEQKLQIASAP